MDYPNSTNMSLARQLRPHREALNSDAADEYIKLKKDQLLAQLQQALVPIAKEWLKTGGRITALSTTCLHILDDVVTGGAATRVYTEDHDSQLSVGDENLDLDEGLGNNQEIEPPRDGAVSRLGKPDEEDELYYQQLRKSKTRPLSAPPGSLRSRVTAFTDCFRTNEQDSYTTAATSCMYNSRPSFLSYILTFSLLARRWNSLQSLASLSRSDSHTSFQDVPSLRRTDSLASINEYVESRPGPPLSRVPRSLSNVAITLSAVPLAPVPESPSPSKSPAKPLRPITPAECEEPAEGEVLKEKKGNVFKRMVKKFEEVMRK